MTRQSPERAADLKIIRFESIYPWPDWSFAALAVINPTTGTFDHHRAFYEGVRYSLKQIEDVHKLLSIPPITQFQEYVRTTDIKHSLADYKGVSTAAMRVTGNRSVYSSFWMGGMFAIEKLQQGDLPVAAMMEGFPQCLACFAEEFRAVYEKVVKEHGVQPEVTKYWSA
ncbi:uncharacterized protein N0V89_006826 [Didymosphaeria variabile]|uniref:Uncharacterized protein n=1 Tax=Didymosphaeria variabile TaxID=1932322 RepID=A0A9W8XJW3_9PLEO|nr:uncharacterized protein N0V89_006826 [Didymosphaeria variabile]KAJ4351483.1 hypothetical protein N0V89_006826 [Didymosphaeria variabile]